MANGDSGVAPSNAPGLGWVSLPAYSDRTIQFTGTFRRWRTVILEGSNDGGTTWATLTDPLGNALSFTSAGMKQITELPELVRPRVTAGDGTTRASTPISSAVVRLAAKMSDLTNNADLSAAVNTLLSNAPDARHHHGR